MSVAPPHSAVTVNQQTVSDICWLVPRRAWNCKRFVLKTLN